MSYEAIALDADQPAFATLNDMQMAQTVAEALFKHYPGSHLWAVMIPPGQGVIQVKNLALAGDWGFNILMNQFATVSELEKIAMRYGGELLERFKVARGRLTQETLAALPTNFAGRHIIQH